MIYDTVIINNYKMHLPPSLVIHSTAPMFAATAENQ